MISLLTCCEGGRGEKAESVISEAVSSTQRAGEGTIFTQWVPRAACTPIIYTLYMITSLLHTGARNYKIDICIERVHVSSSEGPPSISEVDLKVVTSYIGIGRSGGLSQSTSNECPGNVTINLREFYNINCVMVICSQAAPS